MRELPLGRQPITTHLVPTIEKPTFLDRAWERIREEISLGHQAYIVAPRISAGTSEDADLDFLYGEASPDIASVEDLGPKLQSGALNGLRIAPLHGRQSSEVKNSTMQAFAQGEIDVANATVMVIMDADRFGVSQLHQLRGRVGRGTSPGLCLLVTSAAPDTSARERLDAVSKTQDGFELSRIDLEQRREGDVLGATQSGSRSHLRLLRVLRDEALIESARESAAELLAQDPSLSSYPLLKEELKMLQADAAAEFIDKG